VLSITFGALNMENSAGKSSLLVLEDVDDVGSECSLFVSVFVVLLSLRLTDLMIITLGQ
jgi:hypothetical protein